MKLHISKKVAAVTLLLAGFALVAIGDWYHGWAAPTPANEEKDTAIARKTEANPAAVLRAKLAERVDLPNGFEANTTLKDALDFISETYGLPITVDEEAFQAIEVQKVADQPVSLPKMKGVRLSTVMRLLLKQVKGNRYCGAYLVRPDSVEVTTSFVVLTDALGAEGLEEAQQQPMEEGTSQTIGTVERVVSIDVQRQSVRSALRKLAGDGFNIVVDGRVGAQGETLVSATLDNVFVDNAVIVLAEQADLKVVTINNILFVTTPERAATLAAEQKKRKHRVDANLPGGPPPGM
jgi:hypothetical protein